MAHKRRKHLKTCSTLTHTFRTGDGETRTVAATHGARGIRYNGKTYKSATAAAWAALKRNRVPWKAVNGRVFWKPSCQ